MDLKFILEVNLIKNFGEIFIPKIPSYRAIDLAKAISPKSKIKFIGIRPGEKIHEEMISNSEALNVIEYKNHFVLIPNSEFLSWDKKKYMQLNKKGKFCKDDFSYNSKTNKEFLKPQQLQKLIKSHLSDFE